MNYSAGAAWMNGKVIPVSEAKISVFDWGLTRSDITYDVVHVWEGAFFRLEDYLDRFMVSMDKLRLDVGMNRAEIKAALIELVATSGLQVSLCVSWWPHAARRRFRVRVIQEPAPTIFTPGPFPSSG
jgi:branched-subunit amino acid aminotransferase/4-amino-4-deoxychorismate lyase